MKLIKAYTIEPGDDAQQDGYGKYHAVPTAAPSERRLPDNMQDAHTYVLVGHPVLDFRRPATYTMPGDNRVVAVWDGRELAVWSYCAGYDRALAWYQAICDRQNTLLGVNTGDADQPPLPL